MRIALVFVALLAFQVSAFAGGEGFSQATLDNNLQILIDRATAADDANFLWESLEEDMADYNAITAAQFEVYLNHLRTLANYSDDAAWLARAYAANAEHANHNPW